MKTDRWLKYFFLIIFFVLTLLAAFLLGRYSLTEKNSEIMQKNRHQAGYKYISPLLECALSENNAAALTNLENDLRDYIDEAKKQKNVSEVSIFLHDLNNGNWLSINRSERFSPASLLKVPILIAYLKYEESNPGSLQEKVTIPDFTVQVINPNIIPLKSVQPNQTYTIEELLKYAIHYSDNRAANKLLDLMDIDFINKIYTDIGLKIPGTEGEENYMSVVDYATFFEILYNSSYLNREMSEKALEILTNSTFNYGIVGGVPLEIEVAHKFGERIFENYKQLHDCGIVYKKNNPYLLCIMTRGDLSKGDNFNDLAMVIKKVSEIVYRSFGE